MQQRRPLEIATAVGVPMWRLYDWAKREHWPPRKLPRGGPSKVRSKELVALAAQLWLEGVPRMDIAGLCQRSLATIALWRRVYGWPKRPVGRCASPEWERQYRRTKHDADATDRMRTIRYSRRGETYSTRPEWRCCGQIVQTPACPFCMSPRPVT